MNNIFIVSDWHFLHNREFIFKPRGFSSIEEMDEIIIQNHNEIVKPEDDVYCLGDCVLGGADSLEQGLEMMRALNGRLHLVRGNHDSDKRWAAYSTLPNVVEQQNAIYIKYQNHHFYLSHYPTFTGNLEKESLQQITCNLYGHSHQKRKFYNDIPFMYCTCLDAHNNYPVNMDDVIKDMYVQMRECKEMI